MKKLLSFALALFSLISSAHASSTSELVQNINLEFATEAALENLRRFPPPAPEVEEKITILFLPASEKLHNAQIEILAGKMRLVGCNSYVAPHSSMLAFRVPSHPFEIYRAEVGDQLIGSLRECPDQTETIRFVPGETMDIEPAAVRVDYNSTLPIVIYSKIDVEFRYRIWAADGYREQEFH